MNKEILKRKMYTIEAVSYEPWADPEDFELEIDLFNDANKDVVEVSIIKEIKVKAL